MSPDKTQPLPEEFEEFEPTPEYQALLDEEVSDVENPVRTKDVIVAAMEPPAEEELGEFINDGDYMAQESMGERKIISVSPPDEEREHFVMIDGKAFTPKETAQALEDAFDLFGAYDLAVDEYKEGSKKKWAISQALKFKGVDMRRTVPSVRLSAARELFGFFVNKGQEDRFIFLKPAMKKEEKGALENPVFFSKNRGYEA
jgi:hypothetical protein